MPRSLILGYHLFLRIWGKFYLSPPLRVWNGLTPTKWWFDHKHTWDLRTRHDTYPQTSLLLWVIDRIQIGQIFAWFILRDTQNIADWRTAGPAVGTSEHGQVLQHSEWVLRFAHGASHSHPRLGRWWHHVLSLKWPVGPIVVSVALYTGQDIPGSQRLIFGTTTGAWNGSQQSQIPSPEEI